MEAYLYEKISDDNAVRCCLCHHRCLIRRGGRGICYVRENKDGVLHALNYGKIIARHIDPIEKKPLFHFLPGSRSYSIAAVGCNFRCRFCQNADISQMPVDHKMIVGTECSPQNIVDDALKGGCKSISYTYTEPTIYFEFAFDTAKIAHEKGLYNVFVSNGYMSEQALYKIKPYLDAANVDLKAFSDDFYKTYCGAKLEPVKETLKLMKSLGIFVEITTLLIPGLNDNPDELERLAGFIAESLGNDTPWHISRFHPMYQMTDRSSTPVSTLIQAREIGLNAGLKYVYVGNVPGEEGENTICPECGKLLIERWGFRIMQYQIRHGQCPDCQTKIAGVGW